MIDYLNQILGCPMSLIHVIGHSFGAQVAGIVGAAVQNNISRITGTNNSTYDLNANTTANPNYLVGLDPALPGFSSLNTDAKDRLDSSDADFVDVIHTCSGSYGIALPVGHVDFFPNGGYPPQPGTNINTEHSESHYRAVEFFCESIFPSNQFWANACSSWTEYQQGNCLIATTLMGDPVFTTARGRMYLRTNSASPFAKG